MLRPAWGLVVVALACVDPARPLDDLPALRTAAGAVIVARADDCDSNLQLFDVFARPTVRDVLPLVGLVTFESEVDEAAVERSLHAYDVAAPVLRVRAATRDSLRALVRDTSMSVVLYDRSGSIVSVLRPPRSFEQRTQFDQQVATLAATLRRP